MWKTKLLCYIDCTVVEDWRAIKRVRQLKQIFLVSILPGGGEWLSERGRIFEKNIPGNDEMITPLFDGLSDNTGKNLAHYSSPVCWITRQLFVINGYSALFLKYNLILPWHDSPFPVYPSLQVQLWEPLVLVQFAFTSQSWLPLLHSSISRSVSDV